MAGRRYASANRYAAHPRSPCRCLDPYNPAVRKHTHDPRGCVVWESRSATVMPVNASQSQGDGDDFTGSSRAPNGSHDAPTGRCSLSGCTSLPVGVVCPRSGSHVVVSSERQRERERASGPVSEPSRGGRSEAQRSSPEAPPQPSQDLNIRSTETGLRCTPLAHLCREIFKDRGT